MKEQSLLSTDLGVACAVIPKIAKLWGLSGAEIWQRLNTDLRFRNEFGKVTLSLINKKDKTTFEMASDILKGNFITPEKVMDNSVVKYSEQQMLWIYASMPQDEEWYKHSAEKNIILHPSSHQAMNLFDVRKLKPANFFSKEESWWTDTKKELFSTNDYVNLQGYESWCAIKKVPAENSFNQSWEGQQSCILPDEFVPNASQLAFSMSIVEQVVGIRMFSNNYVRTTSVDSDGDNVYLGNFDADGFEVYSCWGGKPGPVIGLAVVQKMFSSRTLNIDF